MGKKLGLKEAAKITGLSEWELRTGANSGRYPHMRVGGSRGKMIFDIELLEAHIGKMMENSLRRHDEPEYGVLRQVKG